MQDTINPSTEEQQASAIFPDVIESPESRKKINNARGILFWIAAAQLLMGCYEYYKAEDNLTGIFALAIDAFVGAIFLTLGLTAKKHTYISLLIGLIAYISFVILFAVLDPSNLRNGVIIKVFFVIYLVKGMKAGKELEELKKVSGGL
jgi:hypothetical protein